MYMKSFIILSRSSFKAHPGLLNPSIEAAKRHKSPSLWPWFLPEGKEVLIGWQRNNERAGWIWHILTSKWTWHTLAEVGNTACSWHCSLSRNQASGVLLGAGFKAWPTAKPGIRNTRFSQVSPVHFLVLVFLSKGPVPLNTNFNLSMNFKGFFCKTFS